MTGDERTTSSCPWLSSSRPKERAFVIEKIVVAMLPALPTIVFCGLYFIRIEHRLTKLETQVSLIYRELNTVNPDIPPVKKQRTFSNRFFK